MMAFLLAASKTLSRYISALLNPSGIFPRQRFVNNTSILKHRTFEIVFATSLVVSGLFFFKVSACSLIIKEVCGGKVGRMKKQSLLKQNLAP